MSAGDDAAYEVGFGKPPKKNQFKPGQSGNPRGRPKGTLNLATTVRKALREKVVVTENGRRRQISKLDAAVTQLVNRAVKGDPRAIQQLLGLAPLFNTEACSALPPTPADADMAVMAALMQRLGRAGQDDSGTLDASKN